MQIEHKGGAPEDMVLSDRPLQIAILVWGFSVMLILYIWR